MSENPSLTTARTSAEVLEAVSRAVWTQDHPGEDCPPDQIPTELDLSDWLPDCPEKDRGEANERLFDMFKDASPVLGGIGPLESAQWHFIKYEKAPGLYAAVQFLNKLRAALGNRFSNHVSVGEVQSTWISLSASSTVKHPLAPLVRAWQRRPRLVEEETRADRFLPGKLAVISKQDASPAQGRLFSTGYGVAHQPGEQLRLFDLKGRTGPCFPIEAFELAGGKTVSAGRGGPAPVDLRLFVEAVLSVRTEDRDGRAVSIEAAGGLRGVAKKLWPNQKQIRKREYEKLARAAAKLDALWIYLRDAQGRITGGRRIVLVTAFNYPEGTGRGADPGRLRFAVDLPRGSEQGPIVTPTLNNWGNSAPAFRGLLNLAYRWHHPGKTRRPVRRGKHWVQVDEPSRYDKITDQLLLETFYPVSAVKQRRRLVLRARKVLERLVKAGEVRVKDQRILPPKVILTDE